ncbi:uncharacterized protein LOC105704283 [Orussus abietinus]|uniref:uncharacterized protein LOC105704283 n=1 Tax=Orussus abietinus TaxID=222816 RepID=UPI000C715D04|nr:uncharacterized protein LOC105704283 [Orussus abietinus]
MDSSEYELFRNMTLLFFFERLMDKGGPRTLHDLSCQFGAKGFTKEMRQIAGGSRSGLKKFLSQYPVLFLIDGDYVNVNSFQTIAEEDNGSKSSAKRDYAQEAVEYFSNKLMQYGAGTEVPIRSLLGHRSQASPEVRHISGQHYKEFRDFLTRYPDSFLVTDDDNIILKQYEGMKFESIHQAEPEISIDPDLTSELLQVCTRYIEERGPALVDQLFNAVTDKIPHSSWAPICKTPQDLSTFLKMFPDSFHIQRNLVTLVKRLKVYSATDGEKPKHMNVETQHTSSQNQICIQSQDTESQDASCNTSPSHSITDGHPQSHNSMPLQVSQSLKQRINMLVMKTLVDNTDKDRSIQSAQVGDAWKLRVLQQTRTVSNAKECLQIVTDIMNPRKTPPDGKNVISFDCEGINLGFKGQLTLVQIGTMQGCAYVFDLLTCPNLMQAGGLQSLLESEDVIKVVHDCRNDSVNLFTQFGITLTNVFDTQAVHAVLQFQETGKPVYKVKNVNLNALCELYNAPCNPLKEQLKNIYRRDQRYWARRPLTRDMLIYASCDVLSLVPQIYTTMSRLIKPEFQCLVSALCEEQVLMHIKPLEVKARKKQRKVETEVADLRKRMEETTGKNIVLSNREIRLLRYLALTEDEKEKLKSSYKVARKLEKLENANQEKGDSSDEDDDDKLEDAEYPSLDSCNSDHSQVGGVISSKSSKPPSLTESMQMVDDILSDGQMDRLEKIEKLEAILSAVTGLPSDGSSMDSYQSMPAKCSCTCHENVNSSMSIGVAETKEVACQTVSTGDIVMTRIFFTEEEKERERLLNSPKKEL